MKQNLFPKFFKSVFFGIVIAVVLSGSLLHAIQKKNKAREIQSLDDLNIKVPAETLVKIIMSMLPSGKVLNDVRPDKAANELFQTVKKIVDVLSLRNFVHVQGKAYPMLIKKTLIKEIKDQHYSPVILQKTLEEAINAGEASVVLILIKANGLSYTQLYEGMREKKNSWKGFLTFIKSLREKARYSVDFNAMPYTDPISHKKFNNPLNYLFELYAKNSRIKANRDYYQEAIDYLIQWAHTNGYLSNMLVGDEDEFQILVENLMANHMEKHIVERVKKYNGAVFKKLNNKLMGDRGYSVGP